MTDQSFPQTCRLKRPADFERVFAQRCSQGDGLLIVYVAERDDSATRIGLVVSRKVGPSVVRNRWKRLIRESFRQSKGKLPAGIDIVCLPRGGATPTLEGLSRSLPKLVAKAWKFLQSKKVLAEPVPPAVSAEEPAP